MSERKSLYTAFLHIIKFCGYSRMRIRFNKDTISVEQNNR